MKTVLIVSIYRQNGKALLQILEAFNQTINPYTAHVLKQMMTVIHHLCENHEHPYS